MDDTRSTPADPAAVQAQRLAELRARRATTAPTAGGRRSRSPFRRRRHVAVRARRLATGLGATATVALVGVMGVGQLTSSPSSPAVPVVGATQAPDDGGSIVVPSGHGRPTTTATTSQASTQGSTHGSR